MFASTRRATCSHAKRFANYKRRHHQSDSRTARLVDTQPGVADLKLQSAIETHSKANKLRRAFCIWTTALSAGNQRACHTSRARNRPVPKSWPRLRLLCRQSHLMLQRCLQLEGTNGSLPCHQQPSRSAQIFDLVMYCNCLGPSRCSLGRGCCGLTKLQHINDHCRRRADRAAGGSNSRARPACDIIGSH